MSSIKIVRQRTWGALLLVGMVGCTESGPGGAHPISFDVKSLVPVTGVVTIGGKPVSSVRVTFMPPSGPGLGSAETDHEGKYVLMCLARPGLAPGDYKVAISYRILDNGELPRGKASSNIAPSAEMLAAKEQLPPEYSDLGRTKLSATIGPKGGTVNFNIPVELPVWEKKTAEGKSAAKTEKGATEKSGETKTLEKKKE